jgi:hypothetical protein
VILEAVRQPVGREAMRRLESAIFGRARRIMPFAILVLYSAGIAMAWQYRDTLARPLGSAFATLLWVKILLAASVLAHFVTAVTLGARGRLGARRSRLVHISVFGHVLAIVVLAKAMFFLTW